MDRQAEAAEIEALEGEGQAEGWTVLQAPTAAPARPEPTDAAGRLAYTFRNQGEPDLTSAVVSAAGSGCLTGRP